MITAGKSTKGNLGVLYLFQSFAVSILFTVSLAFAEVLELRNGDELHGRIVSVSQDSVTFDHDVLGEIEIDKAYLVPKFLDKPGIFGTNWFPGWEHTSCIWYRRF